MEKPTEIFHKVVGWFLKLSGLDYLFKLDDKSVMAEWEAEFKSDAADLKETLRKLQMNSYSVFGLNQCPLCEEAATGLIFISFADKQMNPRCVTCAKKAVNSLVEHVGWKAPYPTQSSISRSC
ncbi:MAG TPA: hypothetical protein VNE63_19175 [Candidatus Acidoferrales bacterium]|nr:hypothetical protein [Candidatus Acidoferrales bacterium]